MANKRKPNDKAIQSQMYNVKPQLQEKVFIFSGPMTVGDFAKAIKKEPNKVIGYFFKNGKAFNINDILDEEKIGELCLEYGYDFTKETEINAQNFMEHFEIDKKNKDLKSRPPIVTFMGHVDHGKTTLVDKIRNSNIAKDEFGNITQHTGAYQIEYKKNKITFLDTPGHEAFTAMRSRGAQITDIVILVVAADDGVMPQTKEAIVHAQNAKVPIIVFINKMDKPNADPDKILTQLSKINVVAEKWGGDVQFTQGSALTGDGIDNLFEAIKIQAEVLELKADYDQFPIGTIIESKVDIGKGTVATLIVENGTLFTKDFIVAGSNYGRIRTMIDTNNKPINKVLPGYPAIITGLNYTPFAGDKFFGFESEKFAKKLANEKRQKDKIDNLRQRNYFSSEDGMKVFNVIVKADVQGTTEAVKNSLEKLGNDEVKVNVISSSVGYINESDILLAQASNATIFAFNIRSSSNIKKNAKSKKVEIKNYSIIYEMIEYIKTILLNMQEPKYEEKIIGQSIIQKIIFFSKIGNIAGCFMESGKITSNSKVRIIREGKVIHTGELDSLQIYKDQVKIVKQGKDFGCHIKKYNDIKENDIIESFIMEKINN